MLRANQELVTDQSYAIPEKIKNLPKDSHIERASVYREEAKSSENDDRKLALFYYFNAIAECELALHDKKRIKDTANIVQSTLLAIVKLDSEHPNVLSEFKNNDILRKVRVALTILGLNEQVRDSIPVLNRADKVNSEKFDVLRQKMADVSISLFNKKQHEKNNEQKKALVAGNVFNALQKSGEKTKNDSGASTPQVSEKPASKGLSIEVTPSGQVPIVEIQTPKESPQIDSKPTVETLTVAVIPKVESPVVEAKEVKSTVEIAPAAEVLPEEDDSVIEVELDMGDVPGGVVTEPPGKLSSEDRSWNVVPPPEVSPVFPDPKPKVESNLNHHTMFRPSSTIIATSLAGAIGTSLYTAGLAAPVLGAVLGGLVGFGSEKAAGYCSSKRPKQG